MKRKDFYQTVYQEMFADTWIKYEQFIVDDFKRLGFQVLETHIVEQAKLKNWFARYMIVMFHGVTWYLKFSGSAKTFDIYVRNGQEVNWQMPNYQELIRQFRCAQEFYDKIIAGII